MGKEKITITNPTESELESTLRFAFQHLSPNELTLRVDMILQQYHSGQIDLNGIFQAKYANNLVGALYAQSRPDDSVMLWVPTIVKDYPLEAIIEPLAHFCQSKGAFAAVALADRNQLFAEQTFCTTGQFRFLSDLIHLAVEIFPNDLQEQKSCLHFIPLSDYSDKTAERLIRLVKMTYQDSHDFPDLMQIAPVESVLHGYQTGALFRPELWFIIQYEGNDVGVLLLTDVSPEQFELTYMGLIESARGQGFSQNIVRFAKVTANQWNRMMLLTAADANNLPACQCYLSQGFKAWDRKKVYARFF